MILARKHLPLTSSVCLRDEHGRLLAFKITINGTPYTIVTLYAPTQDKPQEQVDTLDRLEEFLSEMEPVNLIVGGDFNCLMDPLLDKSSSSPTSSSTDAVRSKISTIMSEWNLVDIWRIPPGFFPCFLPPF